MERQALQFRWRDNRRNDFIDIVYFGFFVKLKGLGSAQAFFKIKLKQYEYTKSKNHRS